MLTALRKTMGIWDSIAARNIPSETWKVRSGLTHLHSLLMSLGQRLTMGDSSGVDREGFLAFPAHPGNALLGGMPVVAALTSVPNVLRDGGKDGTVPAREDKR